ncbi:unnamed protein product [Closterium sp. Naga37s-1]|nr:unnamed protein product [Closterium sp. Naga37s-1]
MAPDAPAPIDVIINASPGIDDALAILVALICPSTRVLGIATSFSHYVACEAATRNARGLCIAAGRPDMPVVQGATAPLSTVPNPTGIRSVLVDSSLLPSPPSCRLLPPAVSSLLPSPPSCRLLPPAVSSLLPSPPSCRLLPPAVSSLLPSPPSCRLLPPAVSSLLPSPPSCRLLPPAVSSLLPSPPSCRLLPPAVSSFLPFLPAPPLPHPCPLSSHQALALRPSLASDVAAIWVVGDSFLPAFSHCHSLASELAAIWVALALRPSLASELAAIWVVGGSFFASGDVNAAAEESVFPDPLAADQVLTSGANIHVLGLNVTTQVKLTDLASLCTQGTSASPVAGENESEHAASPSPAASLVARLVNAYRDHHQQSDHMDGVFLHDACAVAAIIAPSLFTFKRGSVRVECTGVGRGCTLMDYSLKNVRVEFTGVGKGCTLMDYSLKK